LRASADGKNEKTSGTRGILHFSRLTSFAAAKYKTSSENNIPVCVYQNLKSGARKKNLAFLVRSEFFFSTPHITFFYTLEYF
jgi:hypothetical protein